MVNSRDEYPYSDNDDFGYHYEIQDYDAPSPSPYDLEQPSAEYRPETAEALRMLLVWICGARSAATIGARALLLSNLMGIEHQFNKNYSTIAEAAGISREAVRLYSKGLEDFAGIRTSLSRSDGTRKACKRAQLRSIKDGA